MGRLAARIMRKKKSINMLHTIVRCTPKMQQPNILIQLSFQIPQIENFRGF